MRVTVCDRPRNPYVSESLLAHLIRWLRGERRVRSARSVQAEARMLFAQRHHLR